MLDFFVQPGYLLLFIAALLLLIILGTKEKKLFFTRLVVVALLVLALAQPSSLENLFRGGDQELVVLDDVSYSMDVFQEDYGQQLAESLARGQVTYAPIGKEYVSNIGDGIISKVKEGKNILLVSDGQVNSGVYLGDVVVEAQKKNVSISVVEQEPEKEDYSVKIVGPSKIGAGVASDFQVIITPKIERNIVLTLDGEEVAGGFSDSLLYSKAFDSGQHLLKVEIQNEDHFAENNVYYKVVKVVEKPRVLFVGAPQSPLSRTLGKVFSLHSGELFGLQDYHAIVLDNVPLATVQERASALEKYVQDGNGLVVVGGDASFEYGGYAQSNFEDILPVTVSGVGKEGGNVNIVIVLDISLSSGETYGVQTVADVEKALARDVLVSIDQNYNVGVVAFNDEVYIVENMGVAREKDLEAVAATIQQLSFRGTSDMAQGIGKAVDLLQSGTGSKNIILISDGLTQNHNAVFASVTNAKNNNVKIYSIAVGNNPAGEGYLKRVSDETNGNSFKAFQASKLELLFGDPEKKQGSAFTVALDDENHFITQDLLLTAEIQGYNQVAPKNSALLLASADGNPLLSVWRLGLGRVGVLATDNGQALGSELYTGMNTNLVKRLVSWGAGDPERKKPYFIEIGEARVNEPLEIIVRGASTPEVDGVSFEKKDTDLYVATITPERAGFYPIGDEMYAVNYNSEYAALGFNEELKQIALATGGGVFTPENVVQGVQERLRSSPDIRREQKESIIWPLILLALIIFLLDVWFSVIRERKNI